MHQSIALGLALALAACGGVEDSAPFAGFSGKGETNSSAHASIQLRCAREVGIAGSQTSYSMIGDPFGSEVSVEQGNFVVTGDLIRAHIPQQYGQPADHGLHIRMWEQLVGWTKDPALLLFARRAPAPGQPGEQWRVVKIPTEMTLTHQRLAPQGLTVQAEIDVFRWVQVTRSFDPTAQPPRGVRSWYPDQNAGEAGLMYSGLPRDIKGMFNNVASEQAAELAAAFDVNTERVAFKRFADIPALADIAYGPIEWAVIGISHGSGELAGLRFELYVDCPGSSCQSLVGLGSTIGNCNLPPVW